jgi:hypothetical protein
MLKTNSETFAQTRQTQTASSETRTDCPRPWRKVFQYIAGSVGRFATRSSLADLTIDRETGQQIPAGRPGLSANGCQDRSEAPPVKGASLRRIRPAATSPWVVSRPRTEGSGRPNVHPWRIVLPGHCGALGNVDFKSSIGKHGVTSCFVDPAWFCVEQQHLDHHRFHRAARF